ncbi:MAG: hypothetical protein NVS3B18_03150 [Candidatus Dormibacteria bacterium]
MEMHCWDGSISLRERGPGRLREPQPSLEGEGPRVPAEVCDSVVAARGVERLRLGLGRTGFQTNRAVAGGAGRILERSQDLRGVPMAPMVRTGPHPLHLADVGVEPAIATARDSRGGVVQQHEEQAVGWVERRGVHRGHLVARAVARGVLGGEVGEHRGDAGVAEA